ncbi:hypothetical protein [Nocardia jinanensis]|uniref:Uncharacterized protein n=1 Tax=Nocardia jinanensis TaxID=382504 RepID=A0A917RLP3_9NOCA|nr:hypothetical protein [Nocardia jinanensis]GGL13760.1 hypothetical protein GCM10011588_30230 [Nocardia jinanensis]
MPTAFEVTGGLGASGADGVGEARRPDHPYVDKLRIDPLEIRGAHAEPLGRAGTITLSA